MNCILWVLEKDVFDVISFFTAIGVGVAFIFFLYKCSVGGLGELWVDKCECI